MKKETKETKEIRELVQILLDSEEKFTAYAIEKELSNEGLLLTRTTISNLRQKKSSIGKTSYDTIAKLYGFAKKHEAELIGKDDSG